MQQLYREFVINNTFDLIINQNDIALELGKDLLPFTFVFVSKNIQINIFQLMNFFSDFCFHNLNLFRVTNKLIKIWSKNSVKLLNNYACFLNIIKYTVHIDRSLENFICFLKLPSFDSLYTFNFFFSLFEFSFPSIKNSLAFLNKNNSLIQFSEN